METESLRILAVNPGTRYTGVAVFYGDDLWDWGVRSKMTKTSGGNLGPVVAMITKLIETHQINRLILKTLHPSRSSPELQKLVDSLKKLGKERKIVVREYCIDGMKRQLIQRRRTNKHDLMESVVERYTFLISELRQAESRKHPYLVRMFEAVALGMVSLSQLE